MAEQNCYFIIKMVRRPDVPSAPFGSGPEKVIRSPTVTRHRVDIKTSDGLSGPGFIEIADSLAHDGGGEYKLVIKDLTECYKDVLPQDIAKAVQMDHDLQKWLGDAKVWHVGLARTNVQKPNRELC